jgi:hypothetical protein
MLRIKLDRFYVDNGKHSGMKNIYFPKISAEKAAHFLQNYI